MTNMVTLPSGYEIRSLSEEEFKPLWDAHAPKIFDEASQIFRLYRFLSEQEKEKTKTLGVAFGKVYELNLGMFFNGQFVGWCAGNQEPGATFYMRNSAILPEHRRKGLYTALLAHAIDILVEKGFQKISSRHVATNNSIIIPKLKLGFLISSLEISDTFGALVHLTYFPKELRRKILIYRAGDLKPDDEIKKCLEI
jgi:ribosomal protein S18 acetylase RimI-like enzyme